MQAIRAIEKSESEDDLRVELIEIDPPKPNADQCLIEVQGASVNPSDAKALIGKMPHLVWPRIPGRDYAGVVAEGPREHIGKEVWGTGGDLGMRRDGNHAQFSLVEAASISEKPKNLSMLEAGSLGVSWTCAWLGMIEGADVQSGETVAVLGANGKVGQASVQLATTAGARVIAVERSRADYVGHASGPVDVVDLRAEPDVQKAIHDRTDGHGADVIMNSVGSPYFEAACNSLAKKGRQIIISTMIEEMPINLRVFYRGNYRLVGVSNMDHDNIISGEIMTWLRPGFESGAYKPFEIRDESTYGLDRAVEAYTAVLKDETRDCVVIKP